MHTFMKVIQNVNTIFKMYLLPRKIQNNIKKRNIFFKKTILGGFFPLQSAYIGMFD